MTKRKSAYLFKIGDAVRCVDFPEQAKLKSRILPNLKYYVVGHNGQNLLRVSVNPHDGFDGAGIIAESYRFVPWGDEPVDVPEDIIQVGSLVECVDTRGAEQYLFKGRRYRVTGISDCGRNRIQLDGDGYEWQQCRFRLASKRPEAKQAEGDLPDCIGDEELDSIPTFTVPKPSRALRAFCEWTANRESWNRPAYPVAAPPSQTVTPGMTLLEWYAGMALPACIADPEYCRDPVGFSIKHARDMIRRLADVQKEKTGSGDMAESAVREAPQTADTPVDPDGCRGDHCCHPQTGSAAVTAF